MIIKSPWTLVKEVLEQLKTISPDESLTKSNNIV
tara:strand:- start:720 stop:821 length:102 start_codon:yes stop_codon:yes gene_type:complete